MGSKDRKRMDSEEKIAIRHRCPSCFLNWTDYYERDEELPTKNALCDFCLRPGVTSLEILHRMVDIMPMASPSDYPNFTRHLMKHVVLKE